MAVLFFSILVGFVGARVGVIKPEISKGISSIVVKITNPLLILSSVLSGEHLLSKVQVLELTGLAVAFYLLTIGLSFLLPWLLHLPKDQVGVYRFMLIFSNTGFIGYPIVTSLFGEETIFYVSIFVLIFQFFCWSYGVHLISGTDRFRISWRMLLSPCLACAIVAYALYMLDFREPLILYPATKYIGDLTSPLIMLVIGSSLARIRMETVFTNWRLYVLIGIKMVAIPLVMFCVLRSFVANELILGVSTVILCMPIATNSTILCFEYGADDTIASSGVFLSTLLCLVTIPALMTMMFG